ncbi:transposase family protein [Streptomyces sp. NPDC057743]|uniref:transposase family protein n=1 Tax=Streptomyces sp. NPDC057743 TaxID=3346236 RepID=UPI00367D2913
MGDRAAELLKVLFPHLSQVAVNGVVRISRSVRISTLCSAPKARCPGCGTVPTRAHSRYGRRLADTAVAGQETAIDLEVRRFFCDHARCGKRTFAEQVQHLTFPYGRRTMTLQHLLQQIALALGGQAGKRLAERQSAPVNGPTLLRMLRSMELPEVPELSVLGVGEFAFPRRSAKSSTPTALGSVTGGSGRSITRRSSVLRLVRMPRCGASREPARPASASPILLIVERRRSVLWPCRLVSPGTCSTNVRRGHSGVAKTNRRPRSASTHGRPAQDWSAGKRR